MAEAVDEAVRTGEHLLVQAGTGTGKSLAYLVPALRADGPVVISTATLALQSQLIDVDLPRLADAVEPLLGHRPTYAVLKGRHHYLCLARLDGTAEDEEPDLFDGGGGGTKWLAATGRIGKHIKRIRDWADKTDTGDRDELDPGVDDQVWRMVSMPARECVGAQRCPFGAECFADASRARAREADIIVTNHSLLAIDMLTGHQILPEHSALIVDEAHELADRVTSAAQAELSPDGMDRAARRAKSFVDADARDRLAEAADLLTVALGGAPLGRLESLPTPVVQAVTMVDAACRAAVKAVGEIKADDPDAVRRQQSRANLSVLAETAQRLIEESAHDVIWSEVDNRGRRSVVVAPLSVAGLVGAHLYTDRTVIATSATLALGGQFETIARALGLDAPPAAAGAVDGSASEDAPHRWRSLDVGSPFSYDKQGILYVAARLPRPTRSGLSDAASDELVRLVTALGGRTLGLFSSRKAAERAAEVLRAATELDVYLQGEETLPILVRKFREDPTSCLLGVMSLWQGVDVPGDACQLVVIDRLPFPRPDEPLAAARSAAVDARGGSGFAAVSVPVAAVRLAQGAGRLIRSASDRGVVAVLDPRLHTASYGQFLKRSLPPFWYTTDADVAHGALQRLSLP